MRFVPLSVLCLILLGCESVPTEAKREWSAFRKVRVGMSREQVYALAGPSQHTEPCRKGIMRGFVVESWLRTRIVERYRDAPAKMEVPEGRETEFLSLPDLQCRSACLCLAD
jgi:hypothetical protein